MWVFASYISSKQNVQADIASRVSNIDTEWELSATAFTQIQRTFGQFSIDLFASRINNKCRRFCSRFPDPDATIVDAFTFSWHKENFYAFPPFALILPMLRKIISDSASGVVVVPYWPTQPWYPLFLSLLSEPFLKIEASPDLLSSPCRQIPHPLAKSLSLVAGKLSSTAL